jgi:hypothetical protein
MPDVDDHMDELFQKAADNYPLKTMPGNFDELLPFVAGNAASANKPVTGKRKTALLLLAFIVTGAIVSTHLVNRNAPNIAAGNKESMQPGQNTVVKNHPGQQATLEPTETHSSFTLVQGNADGKEDIFQKNKFNSTSKARFRVKISPSFAETVEAGTETETYDWGYTDVKTKQPTPAVTDEGRAKDDNTIPGTKKEPISNTEPKKELPKEEPILPVKSSKKNRLSPYYGIAAGTELNQVKSQGMTRTGFNGGVVLGLRVSKKISIETGIQVSQKKYHTNGKHFNPKPGSMPSNMTISSLDGTSTLFEVPVSIKYDLTKKKKGFYVKAGVSSYIMTKEANRYQAVVSGQEQEINSTYKNADFYTAAQLRLAAGYQHTVGKKMNARVEPYIQIPLKGIGIGTLPVTGTGLQLVLTRN